MADLRLFEVTLVTDTNAYADNDVMVIPQAVEGYFVGELATVVVLDEADQAQDIDLVFFNASAALGTINGAVNITDADARKVIGTVSIVAADYCDLVNNQIATKRGIGLPLMTQSLYIGAICRSGTPTYAADSLKLKLFVKVG